MIARPAIKPDPDFDLSDATEVYGVESDEEIFQLLDDTNDCDDPGGHLYLTQDGETWCLHCGMRAP